MLSLEQIIQFARQEGMNENMARQALVEYLQCILLRTISRHEKAGKLHFIGGTSLRFFWRLPRFSEDLDFDNFGISVGDFEDIIQSVKAELESQGFMVDTLIKIRGAYHCYVRFANLLFHHQLSAHANEKILIKVDATVNDYMIRPERRFFNRYGIVEEIKTNPLDIIMAQKTIALLERSRAKGRDFFDFVFLDGLIKPNLAYLRYKINITSLPELKERILAHSAELDFSELAREVTPFLFNPSDIIRVEKFKEYISNWLI